MGEPQIKDGDDETDKFVDELKPGTKLMHGQYTIERFLNAGGFGITYLAKDSLDRKIVIKECFPGAFCRRSRYVVQARSRAHQAELKSIVRLFVQEARSLAKLDHPNIVGVHQVFEDNDTAYMALDFVEGRDLLDTIEDPNHSLTPDRIKTILAEVLSAVGFIHDQDILHRDISPDNILINEEYHPVLIDFGAAREEATKQSRVLSALRVVKDGYSPQEFYIAGSEQSPSSDLYALAASFYHLISNDVPPNSQARLAAIASAEPDPYQPLAGRVEGYEGNFLAAIDKALAVLPKDRLQSASDWIDMINGATPSNVTPLKVSTQSAAPAVAAIMAKDSDGKKSKLPLLLGSAAVLALLVGIGVFTMTGGDGPATPVEAPTVEGTVDTQPVATTEAPIATEVTPTDESTVDVAAAEDAPVVSPTPEVVVPQEPASDVVEDPVIAAVDDPATQPIAPGADDQPTVPQNVEPRPVIIDPAIVDGPTADQVRPALRPETFAAPEQSLPEPQDTPRIALETPEVQPELPVLSGDFAVAETGSPDLNLPQDTDESTETAVLDLDIQAVTPGNELVPEPVVDVSELISSRWKIEIPFTADPQDPKRIGEVAIVSPIWASTGSEVLAVNGIQIDDINQINPILQVTTAPNADGALNLGFQLRDPATGTETNGVWSAPVVQETVLSNGMEFSTTFNGTEWITTIVSIPENVGGDFQEGDILTQFLQTGERLTERTSVQEIFERELAAGKDKFGFAVSRDGGVWVASMQFDGGTAE